MPVFVRTRRQTSSMENEQMKYLLKVVALGCFFMVTGIFYSRADAACLEEFIYDCFDPDNYDKPWVTSNTSIPNPCKTWTSSTIKCPGDYYMVVYVNPPPSGQIISSVSYQSTCPGNVNVQTLNGDEIENILRTSPPELLAQLSVNEIREGKVPVFVRFKCYEIGEGNVTLNVNCRYDSSGDLNPFDPIGGVRLLLLPDRKK